MLDWSRFHKGSIGAEKAFEAFSAQLFERWLRREYGHSFASYTLNGAGGDGGVEAFARLSSGTVVGFQAKWFKESIKAGEIKKIRSSLERAVQTFPDLSRYVVAQRQNLTKARKDDESGGVERWENFIASVQKAFPKVEIIRWDEAALLDQLAQPGNQEIKALWFDGEFTSSMIIKAWEKTKSRLGTRYLPDLHAVGAIDEVLDRDLWCGKAVGQFRQGLELAREALADASNALKGFIRMTEGRRPAELGSTANESVSTLKDLSAHVVGLLEVLASGPKLHIAARPTTLPLSSFENHLRDFAKTREGTYTASHAEGALRLAWEAYEKITHAEDSLRASAHPRLVIGPPGCGKTHAAAAGVHRRVDATHPSVLLLAKTCSPRDGAARILAEALDTHGWPLGRMLDALEALAVLHQASKDASEEDNASFERALLLIDGLEEAADSYLWGGVLGDLAVELSGRPRIHLIATTRPEFSSNAELPKSFGHFSVNEHGDVDLPALLGSYARVYSVNIEAVPWLGWALRTALEIRLLAEEFQGRSVSAAEGANANALTLFRRKLKRIEEEALRRAGENAWTDHLELLPASLEALSVLTIEGDRVRIGEADVIARLPETDPEFTASRVRIALALLQAHGLIDRYVPPARGLRSPQPEYSLSTRHLSDFVLATRLAEVTTADLARGKPVSFPTILLSRRAASVLFAAQLAEQGHFLVDITWNAPPPDLLGIHAESLGLLPQDLAATRRTEIVHLLLKSTAINRALIRGLVLPVSRVPSHPLGPMALDEALRSLALVDRDPVWSVPEDLDGKGPWSCCFDQVLDEVELVDEDPWNGPPLVAAWTTSTVIKERRERTRTALAVWGSARLREMVLLLEHMSNVDDPQILDDCVLAALGAAIGAPIDDDALLDLARLMDELFFRPDAKAWTESIPVRSAARGVVERAALAHPSELAEALKRARPPYAPKGGWPVVDRQELIATTDFGGEIVTRDLSWYVAERCFRDFSGIAATRSSNTALSIDDRLLNAIDKGLLAAPHELAERRAAEQASKLEERAHMQAALKTLVCKLGALPQDFPAGRVEDLDEHDETEKSEEWDADVLTSWLLKHPQVTKVARARLAERPYSNEFRELMAHFEAEAGQPEPSPKAVRNGMIAHLVRSWGWSKDNFEHLDPDDHNAGVDIAITRTHGSGASHGSRSEVCRFREKYVWAAVDRVAGALADRMPVWNHDSGSWERLRNLEGLGHELPDPLPQTGMGDAPADDPRVAWAPEGVLIEQFQEVDDLASRAERWLSEVAPPDPRIFLSGNIERWKDAVVLRFSHLRRGHQSCIDQLVQVRAFGVRSEDLEILRRDAPFVLSEHYGCGATIEEGVYGSPALTCWAPWFTWTGVDQGYVSFTEAGEPRMVEVRAATASVTARFEGEWPQEPDVAMLSPDLARAFNVAKMCGNRWLRHYLDSRGEPVAIERDVKAPYIGFDHHYLVSDRTRFVDFFASKGLIPMWIVRVFREATPALYMYGSQFEPRPGLVHRSRDTIWMVTGDPAAAPETVLLADELEKWNQSSSGSEEEAE